MIRIASCCTAAVVLALATTPLGAEEIAPTPAMVLTVLDAPSDDIDGAVFIETLDAYIGDLDVVTGLTAIDAPPGDHDGWVSLANRIGAETGALAVLWFEPATDMSAENNAYDIYLVLLEQHSQAVIILPIQLGIDREPSMFRVLAATTRMVLDTEILDDIQVIAETSRADPPPEPWPVDSTAESTPSPAPAVSEPTDAPHSRSFDLHLGYAGDLGHGGPTVLHGVRFGALIRLLPWLGPGVDVGYLTRGQVRVEDVDVREQRLPVRLLLSFVFPAGPTEAVLSGFWNLEPLWIGAQVIRNAPAEKIGPTTEVDTGGGVELRWRFPLSRRFGLNVAVSGQGMAVSHAYERGDGIAIHPSYFRLGWSAGVDVHGL